MISERTLRNWRRDALKNKALIPESPIVPQLLKENFEQSQRILRLTQELMDFHLIRKG